MDFDVSPKENTNFSKETWLVINPRIRSEFHTDTRPDTKDDGHPHTSSVGLLYEIPLSVSW